MSVNMVKRKPQAERPYRDRQADAMAYIRRHVEATGRFPSKNALARAMGAKNVQTARDMLERLTISGHLNRVNTTMDTPEGKRQGWSYELAGK